MVIKVNENILYVKKLKEKYKMVGLEEKFQEFEKNRKGIDKENKKKLLKEYPDIPKKLLELLLYCDGSNPIYFLGSDVEDGRLPYYLLSSKEMIATKDYPVKYHSYDINREDGSDEFVSEEITRDINNVSWLHFADCMNNGGSSRLFIDFTPSDKGKKGQVIRFVHDDDRLEVIADSFDDYLKMLLDNNLPFIYNDEEMGTKTKKIKKDDNKKNNKLDFGSYLLFLFVLVLIVPPFFGFYLISFIVLVIFFLVIIGIAVFGKKNNGDKAVVKEEVKEPEEPILSQEQVNEILKEIEKRTKTVSYKIKTIESNNLSIFDSKFGGLPYWDLKLEYPKDNYGNNMILLAQINFEKEKFDNELLPKKGILQFYISTEDGYGLFGKNGYEVYYHDKINHNISKEDIVKLGIKASDEIDDFPIQKELALEFNKSIESLAPTSEYTFESLFKEITKDKFDIDLDVPIYQVLDKENSSKLYDEVIGSKILGCPYFCQQEPAFVEDNILLLQIDSDDSIIWGDSGVCNFFIKKEDLKNKDFSNVLYNWDCC